MPLSWNEIKSRALAFSKEWAHETSEDAEAKSFWDAFFDVFGVSRRRLATFEKPVLKLGDSQGFIDLFWKGVLIAEHKSRGRDLGKAYTQALDYFHGLKECELPRFVIVSDFARMRLYNLESSECGVLLDSILGRTISSSPLHSCRKCALAAQWLPLGCSGIHHRNKRWCQ